MKKNEGFSLVELIVAIAIMSVLISLVAISITVVGSQKVGSAASDIKSQFQTAQTISMSKDDCFLDIQADPGNGVTFTTYSSDSRILDKRLVESNITVTVKSKTGVMGTGAFHFRIRYNRENGSMKPMTTVNGFTETECGDIEYIKFSNGRKTVTLYISQVTGKVTY